MSTNTPEQLYSFIQQLPGCWILKDPESKFLVANKTTSNTIGIKNPDNCIGITDYDVPCEAVNLAGEFIKEDRDALERGNVSSLYITKYQTDEIEIYQSFKNPFIYEEKLIGVLGHMYDITSQRNISQAIYKHYCSHPDAKKDSPMRYSICDAFPNSTLTKRESECLFYLMHQRSIKETAQLMSISFRTVESHVENIKTKLDCHSKHQLIDYAFENGFYNVILKRLFNERHICLRLDEQ